MHWSVVCDVVEPDVVDSLLDDVDSLQIADSDQEPQNKPQVKPYRRAAPEVDNIKVFIHGHLRGSEYFSLSDCEFCDVSRRAIILQSTLQCCNIKREFHLCFGFGSYPLETMVQFS